MTSSVTVAASSAVLVAAARSLFELGTLDIQIRVTDPEHDTDETVASVLVSQNRMQRSAEPEKKLPVSNGNHAREDTAAEWEDCAWVGTPVALLLPWHEATSGHLKIP